MKIYDKIIKSFAKNLEYNDRAKANYAELLSHFENIYDNFDDVVDITNYWLILFLFKIDRIFEVNSTNRMYFKPKFRNQISEAFAVMMRKHVQVQPTMAGFRIFGKDYYDEAKLMSDMNVYVTAKNIITECADPEVFTVLIRGLVNDLSTKEPRYYRTDFPRLWAKKVKPNNIDSAIEVGFQNYIRRGGVFADAMLKDYKKFKTNSMGFNVFIWHEIWHNFKETSEYKIIYRELLKLTNNY